MLFKKFAGVDVFDIEVEEPDPRRLVEIIAALEPTFDGINLEDIEALDCFLVERGLRERMKIPVFFEGSVLFVDGGEQSNSIVLARRGQAFERHRPGVVRGPNNPHRSAANQLLAAFALITSALKDQRC